MKCTICGEPIILVPSAQERAEKWGKPASYYTSLFSEHSNCVIEKRNRDVRALIRRTK